MTSAGGALGAAPSLAGKTICYIQEGSVDYFNKSAQGAAMAVKALGGKLITLNSNVEPAKELANVQDCITKRASGILLFSISEGTLGSSSRLARNAGIPVVDYYGQGPNIAKKLASAWIGADSYQAGLLAGQALAKELATGASVAEVQGLEGRFDVGGYTAGFADVMKQAGHKIVATPSSGWVRAKALSETATILQKYPHLGGIFCHNDDTAVGCARALQQAGRKPGQVKMVTLNGSATGVDLMKAGWLQADIGWSPSQESVIAVHMLALLLKDSKAGLPPAPCHAPMTVISAKNPQAATPWEPTDALVQSWLKVGCEAG